MSTGRISAARVSARFILLDASRYAHSVVRLEALLIAVMMLTITLAIPAGTNASVPSGFTDTLIASVNAPTDVAFTPTGKLLVTSQSGSLFLVTGGAATKILDISSKTCTDFERGLLGVTADPSFATNNYIYIFYTVRKNGGCTHNNTNAAVNRVSRFQMSGNSVLSSSETILVDNMPSPNGNHNGGDLLFGNDGFLYISIGDGGCDLVVTSNCGGANQNARKRNILTGKILRITRDGGIPTSNPFRGSDSGRCNVTGRTTRTHCQETFVWGLRNPFRIALDPNASGTKIYINDVGQNVWEEIDQAVAGSDYGWNVREGFCVNGSPTNCGSPPSGMRNPVFAYQHDGSGCNSITGGAFVPNGVWPSAYTGSYLYADYVCGKIFRLKNGSSFSFASNLGRITTLQFGPYGSSQALYYTSYSGQVRRISTNRFPVAVAKANPRSGLAPLTVKFDGSESTDPDNDPLTYKWDFDDGSAIANGAKVQHTFTANVVRNVKLTVSDGKSGTVTTTIKIDVGNTPPEPTITSPLLADLFVVGQAITLQGSATDTQEGLLPNSGLKWDVMLHHDTHEHPLFSGTGNNLHFLGPAPEDLFAATNSYLVIKLTATDSSGLSKSVSQTMMPKKVEVTVDTSPAGLAVLIEGTLHSAPATVTTWAGNILDLTALDQVLPSGEPLVWDSWSVAGGQTFQYSAPTTNSMVTANLELVTGPAFLPTADARVRESEPTRIEGMATGLTTKGGNSDFESFIRFEISGISGPVVSATLYLFAYDGTTDGPAIYKTSGSWSEAGLKWTNRPSSSGGALDDAGAIPAQTWFTLDVTNAINGNGKFNFLLRSISTDAMSAYSREASSRQPRLVVVTSGGSGDSTAPTVPAGLTADAPTSSRIDLVWNASADDVAVSGYDIFRNGVLLTSTSKTSYTDVSVSPNKSFQYQVRARDAAGNVSALSEVTSIKTPTQTKMITLAPAGDTYVSESSPTTNYARSSVLKAEGGSDPDLIIYLRFQVKDLPGTVYRARLRLFVPAGSNNGSIDGPAVYRTSSSWSETMLNWVNRPAAASGTSIDDAGFVTAGTWVEYDVTSVVSRVANYGFMLVSISEDQVVFSSQSGANAPQLVITAFLTGSASVAEVVNPTPTPTPAPTVEPTLTPTLPITDDFESGTLSGWTAGEGIQASNAIASSGSFSAVARSDGTENVKGAPASAWRSLGKPVDEIYAKFALFVDSSGPDGVDLVAPLDFEQRALVTLFVDDVGRLALRNERNGEVLAFDVIGRDTWHDIQIHLASAGSRSVVKVWLDGGLVYSGNQDLAEKEIAGVRIGDDNTNRTYVVAFDDVVLHRECVGTCTSELATPEPTATPVKTEPALEPTAEASAEPTADSTPVPADEPTIESTAEPTMTATSDPTATPAPQADPTQEPAPTEEPEA